jgi:hypothetical protein
MTMRTETTSRGFQIMEIDSTHRDYPGPLEVQQSSAIGATLDAYARPGSSFLWVGVGEARAHLDRDAVGKLAELLTHWLNTGRLFDG